MESLDLEDCLWLPGFKQPFPAQRSQHSLKKEHFIVVLMRPNALKLLEVLLLFLKVRLSSAIKQTGREALGSLPVSVRRALLPSAGDRGEPH